MVCTLLWQCNEEARQGRDVNDRQAPRVQFVSRLSLDRKGGVSLAPHFVEEQLKTENEEAHSPKTRILPSARHCRLPTLADSDHYHRQASWRCDDFYK
eukprot:scaffold155249_cov70-Cyclotella_meneghiniana.AAC.2